MTYVTLNMVFLGVIVVALGVTALLIGRRMPWRTLGLTLTVTLVMTAIFDNVIIGAGLVAYDDTRISGVRIGLAPIEDFAYTIAVAVIVMCVSVLGTRKDAR
ncbi:MAG: lycopene cyclase domain-containing protein [Microbacteriaceae bacterium]|nr:lycopene cyclase domain-containing protein [Microbacteriaceae bacterium]